jgi:tripartite-type tricarboxylate transporter receptor subunit TctC
MTIFARAKKLFPGHCMFSLRYGAWVMMISLLAAGSGVASGQSYPNKPIRIVTGAAGGAADFVTRTVAQGISGALGQPTVVENKPSGVIEGDTVAKSAPDGYTLLVTSGNLWISGFLQTAPYDVIKDFVPITQVATSPSILVVHPQLPVKSVKGLIDLAKARPGELNYVSLSAGSTNHLAGELFKALTGVNVVRVAYKSAAVATTDLIGGQVQMMFNAVQTAAPHIKSGKLRALAVTSAQPSALFPDLPSMAATVPGYESAAIYGAFAPAKTPAAIVGQLQRTIVEYLRTPQAKERLFNGGVEAVGNTPEQFTAMMKADMAKWGKVIRDAGIQANF